MSGRGLLAIGILIFQLAPTTLAADNLATGSFSVGLEKLFDAGATPSAKSLAAARAQQSKLRKLPDFDARAKYAFAVVLVQQRQIDEARRVLSEVLKDQPDLLPAWQAKIWSDLTARAYPAALADMRAAASALENVDPDATRAITEQRQMLARTLGRGIGFLMTTVDTKIPPQKLAAEREEILAKMGTDRAAFLIGQQTIATEIGAIDVKLVAVRTASDAAVAKQEEEQTEKKREVSKAVAEVDFQTLKNQAETGVQLKSSNWEIEQLERQLAKVQFELNVVCMKLVKQQVFLQQTVQALDQADRDRAAGMIVNQRQAIYAAQQIPLANNNLRQFGQEYEVLCQQSATLKMELATALGQREGIVDNSDDATADLEEKSHKLKHDEKKIDYARKQAARPAGAGRALAEQKRSYSSFEPFPFEEERDRVLAWFGKANNGK